MAKKQRTEVEIVSAERKTVGLVLARARLLADALVDASACEHVTDEESAMFLQAAAETMATLQLADDVYVGLTTTRMQDVLSCCGQGLLADQPWYNKVADKVVEGGHRHHV